MSADPVHPSAVGTNNTRPQPDPNPHPFPPDLANDPSLPPQQHAGAVGLGPNYPLGPSLGDKIGGLAQEIKGKALGKPELVERGRDRRTGELMRKEREQDEAANPFKGSNGQPK